MDARMTIADALDHMLRTGDLAGARHAIAACALAVELATDSPDADLTRVLDRVAGRAPSRPARILGWAEPMRVAG